MVRRIHIFHHNDTDGRFAAALMYQYFKKYDRRYRKTVFYSIDYITEIDLEDIPEDDCLIFVDYSFSNKHNRDQFIKAHERNIPIIWIDHHKSSEYMLYNILGRDLYGIQEQDNLVTYYDTIHSATKLAWIYCRSRAIVKSQKELWDQVKSYVDAENIAHAAPNFIDYVDRYDMWKFAKTDNAHLFHYGIDLEERNLKTLISDILSEKEISNYNIFEADIDEIDKKSFKFIQDIIGIGAIVFRYNETKYKHDRDFGAFEFTITDNIKSITWNCIAMNIHSNSESFGELYDEYDIVCPFVYSKEGIWKYSLFTGNMSTALDLSYYAEILGDTTGGLSGGGHRKASGFQHKDMILTPGCSINIKKKTFSGKPTAIIEKSYV